MNQLIPITQLALPIPAPISDAAWQRSQVYSTSDARWNFYLNQLATELLAEYLQADFPQIQIWQETNIWQFVSGSVLQLNHKRIVLLPSRAIDNSELVIAQEWLDLPAWAGDYFIAVQIDPDTETLHCWGYLTHQMMKSKARYDPLDRTYQLDAHHLIADVSGLWAIQSLNPTEVTQTAIAPLASVNPVQAANLLHRLATVPNPRLEIPFALWGALVSDRQWRQQLARLRQGETAPVTDLNPVANQLGGWLQNVFAPGWQAVEDFLGTDAEFALRQTATAPLLVRRVKAFELDNKVLLLLISIETEADNRLAIQVQLRPTDRVSTLPPELTLSLLSLDDEVVRSVVTRDRDNAIGLPRFRSNSGTGFKIQVRSGNTTICESFLV
ncbi:DUF1822 family protein [Chamaesiphon sp. GL140_3_metabinner_50]|uniref:DUF1822 family protein n=1 Tax=Chamaesiphon sp. GL140_3_metabinner_50 TaxID=2970812 RepID=UPI0025E6AE3A|nr:DUF1822 family protein [Chamaesiphon sp. GL140_3_metabinner_50]